MTKKEFLERCIAVLEETPAKRLDMLSFPGEGECGCILHHYMQKYPHTYPVPYAWNAFSSEVSTRLFALDIEEYARLDYPQVGQEAKDFALGELRLELSKLEELENANN